MGDMILPLFGFAAMLDGSGPLMGSPGRQNKIVVRNTPHSRRCSESPNVLACC
jgi:hypothetical protein